MTSASQASIGEKQVSAISILLVFGIPAFAAFIRQKSNAPAASRSGRTAVRSSPSHGSPVSWHFSTLLGTYAMYMKHKISLVPVLAIGQGSPEAYHILLPSHPEPPKKVRGTRKHIRQGSSLCLYDTVAPVPQAVSVQSSVTPPDLFPIVKPDHVSAAQAITLGSYVDTGQVSKVQFRCPSESPCVLVCNCIRVRMRKCCHHLGWCHWCSPESGMPPCSRFGNDLTPDEHFAFTPCCQPAIYYVSLARVRRCVMNF